MKVALALSCALLSTGCAASLAPQAAADFGCNEDQIETEDVRAYFQRASGCGQEDYYLYDGGQGRWVSLRERAAFELSCDKDALKVTMLDSVTFGVTGCNTKAVYKQLPFAGWVLDTVSEGGGAPVPAGATETRQPGAPAPPPPAPAEPAPTQPAPPAEPTPADEPAPADEA